MLLNEFDAGLAAQPATARDRAEALGRCRREFHRRRELDIDDIFGQSREGAKVCAASEDSFREKKTGGQLHVISRSAHGGCDSFAPDTNLERLFDCDLIGHAFVVTVFLAADDASRADSLHATSSHEMRRKRE